MVLGLNRGWRRADSGGGDLETEVLRWGPETKILRWGGGNLETEVLR
jgi:hypothetical protein